MEQKRTWCVYMHTNKINGKKYIGVTGLINRNYRWHVNGNGYSRQVFGKAIEKYGWDNFEHVILFDNLSKQDAYKLEEESIKKYHTYSHEYGYNVSLGGEHAASGAKNNGLSKPVYQYSIDGNYINGYISMMDAERQTGISNSTICSCCKGKMLYSSGYTWRYEKFNSIAPIDVNAYIHETVRKPQEKVVYQYDKECNLINTFISLSNAARSTGFDFRMISNCCLGRNKSYKGYVWSYVECDSIESLTNRANSIKPYGKEVFQYDINGNLLGTFRSVLYASKVTGISKGKISRNCNKIINCVDDTFVFSFTKNNNTVA